jgi:hypothetical protein
MQRPPIRMTMMQRRQFEMMLMQRRPIRMTMVPRQWMQMMPMTQRRQDPAWRSSPTRLEPMRDALLSACT